MTPKILMLQLKRFTSKKGASKSGKSGFFNLAYAQICQQEKVDEPVDFPLDGLDVQKYVKMNCKEAGVSSTYDLFGIVNHFGSLNGGHYTATCKNSVDGEWYYFNDSSVSSAGHGGSSRIMADAAYVLFYRRRDNVPTDTGAQDTPVSEGPQAEPEQKKESNGRQNVEGREEEKTAADESEEDDDAKYLNELD